MGVKEVKRVKDEDEDFGFRKVDFGLKYRGEGSDGSEGSEGSEGSDGA